MFNSVILIGRPTSDPILQKIPDGDYYTRFRLAVPRTRFKNMAEETDFFTVVAFRNNAKNCCQYLGKGKLCLVEGTLNAKNWTDRYGQRREDVVVKSKRVLFLEYGNNPKKALETLGEYEGMDFVPAEIEAAINREIDIKRDVDMPFDIGRNAENPND